MTAEIAICNRSAIALAADSAVTIGSGSGKERVWKHANKLFSLGPHNDIGIMIYNSGDFIGFPWEVVIKEFKKFSGSKVFKTVQECTEFFFDYIGSDKIKVNENLIEINNLAVHATVLSIISFFKKKIHGIDHKDKSAIFSKFDLEYRVQNENLQKIPVIKNNISKKLFDNIFLKTIKDFSRSEFKFALPKNCIKIIADLSFERLNRCCLSPVYSGIVFAGFGKDELTPVVINYIVDGKINSRLRYWVELTHDFNTEDGFGATIFPFAQSDMFRSFVEGITTQNLRFISRIMLKLLEEKSNNIINDYVFDKDAKIVERAKHRLDNRQIIKGFQTEFERYRNQEFVQPVMRVVRSLPKEEMAAMAEALVEITALRRKVDSDVESVGGPIDVAVISKGDGFIWIKRKHYFSIDLNRDFLYRKALEAKGGGDD